MKKLLTTLSILCAFGLIASSALAVATAAQNSNQDTKVPQAQIDMVKKREAMKKRREELLKMRQQLIQSNDPGNVDGQAKKQ